MMIATTPPPPTIMINTIPSIRIARVPREVPKYQSEPFVPKTKRAIASFK
ncbi:hypothetical protein [Bradyrhizobium sp. CCGB01]|nr:hypothetical protein [Bradyrhizobium sp. CCGB01]MCP3410042.1 hypothetical protein [Bradyrhizobium sp. CCGB01]